MATSTPFDLQAYLARIGFMATPVADVATLQQIALRHAQAIAFENLDPFLGRPVSLVPGEVEEKLVRRRRGGWCFEQNLLLGNALRALGFHVDDLAGRVLWKREETARTPRTHHLLRVCCGGGSYLVDAGFGRLSLTGVLDMASRDEQRTPHESFRLRDLDGDHLLEARLDDAPGAPRWVPLYRFDLQRQWPMDFEAANFQLACHPASQFVTGLRVARPAPEGRYTLGNRELTFRDHAGNVDRRIIGDARQLVAVLRETFGIEAPDVSLLETRFATLV